MQSEKAVAEHYGRKGLEAAILTALKESGKDPDRLRPDDLSGVDEFHLGWRAATVAFARDLGLSETMELLDIGCGIGGPARYFAEAHGCRVVGIDLTEDYVETAKALTRRCGLAGRVSFQRASGLCLPFEEGRFDRATLIHVGMNIEDKARLFAEAGRVLKPGGRFGFYEVMQVRDGEVRYPVPWTESAAASFLEWPATYRGLLKEAGFEIEAERDRTEMSLKLARQMRIAAREQGAPPLGLHILMGPATHERVGNVMAMLEAGLLAPIEMIARRT